MKKQCGLLVALGLLFIGCSPGAPPLPPPTNTAAPPTIAPTPAPTLTPSATPTVTPTPRPSILRVSAAEPLTLDPALAGDADSAGYVVELFSGLVMLDRNLNVAPDLAEKWDTNAERTVFTFYLRKGARFHDGRPVTAQDFKYSIERAADPALQSQTAATYLGDIVGVKDKLTRKATAVRGVEVVDDTTLRITIDAPKAYFLSKLTYHTAFVVDKNNIERDGRAWMDKPNGTGSYKLKEYVRKDRLVLVKNENYYLDPKPQVEQVVFLFGAGSPSPLTPYSNGEIDVVALRSDLVNEIGSPSHPLNKELSIVSQLDTGTITFNLRKPPFDDLKVRQAFALAIDRKKVLDDTSGGMITVAKSILPPKMPGYNETLPDIAYNPDRAKQLLAESRYAGRLPQISWGTLFAGRALQAIVDMLKKNLDANISVQQVDAGTLYSRVYSRNNPYHVFDFGWIADYPDPENFLAILFSSTSSQNTSGYSNPEVDKLLDQAGIEKDASQRLQLYQQAEQKILQDYPAIPYYHSRQYWLTKPHVKDLIFPPIVIPRLRYVTLQW